MGRGSGRTYNALAGLPDGGLYIVPHYGIAQHCMAVLQQQGRDKNSVKFITIARAEHEDRLRGLHDLPAAVDHWWYEDDGVEVSARAAVRDFFSMAALKRNKP